MTPLPNPPRTALWAAALIVLGASNAHAATRCQTGGGQPGERVACEKALQSPEALRQYIERTRWTFNLHFWDYTTPEQVDAQIARQRRDLEAARVRSAAKQ